LAALVKKVQDLFDGIWRLFTGNAAGTGKDLTATLGAISGWLNTVFKPVKDGLAIVQKTIQTLLDAIFSLFGGTAGTGTITDAVTALKGWFGNFHKLLDALFGAFGGVAGTDKAIADVIGAVTGWFANFQSLLDGLFGMFGGVAGTGKTIAEVLAAMTGWFSGIFKKLVDGINSLASLIPGFSGSITNPIQGVIDVIGNILGIGQSAQASAEKANMGIHAILAGQNGGGHDEFDYKLSANLPSPWVATYMGNATSTLGPDGKGYAKWKYSGFINTWRAVHYRKTDVTMPNSNCVITVALLEPPGYGSTDVSKFYIEALWAGTSTDQSRVRVEIGPTYAQFQTVSATGAVTNVGSKHTIPRVAARETYALQIRNNAVSVMTVNGTSKIIQASENITVGNFPGRHFGFGSMYAGTLLGGPSSASFMGITWQD